MLQLSLYRQDGESTGSSLCLWASLPAVQTRHNEKDGSLTNRAEPCAYSRMAAAPTSHGRRSAHLDLYKDKGAAGLFQFLPVWPLVDVVHAGLAHFPWQPSCRSTDTLPTRRRSWRPGSVDTGSLQQKLKTKQNPHPSPPSHLLTNALPS